MKYLLVVALAFAVFWLWRHNRRAEMDERNQKDMARRAASGGKLPPIDIVECAVCGVHLPTPEALQGVNAHTYYCCEAHRRQAGA